MIYLRLNSLSTLQDARELLQKAVGVEFGTLPPYLYALYTIQPETNPQAQALIRSVALEEMIHMCLAANILNALGGTPEVNPQAYPGPLPGDIGPDGTPLKLRLLPFSKDAMAQAMKIEQPEDPPDFPIRTLMLGNVAGGEGAESLAAKAVTIGQFYTALDALLETLPASVWIPNHNQITDDQFFAGQIFAINSYADAHRAITGIVSEGEGSNKGTNHNPLDFEDEVAHYYRFGEIFYDRVLTKSEKPEGYTWGPAKLGVDWNGVYPAIADPAEHDFSKDSPQAQAAQLACNQAFSKMVDALRQAFQGNSAALGHAVAAMYQLRMAAKSAVTVPLADGVHVAGPAFVYIPAGGSAQ